MTVGGRWARARPETDPPNERGRGESDLRQSYELAVVSEWRVTLRWLYHRPSQLPGKGDTFAGSPPAMCSVGGRAVSELNLDRLAPDWAVRGRNVMSRPRTARGSLLRGHHRPPDRSIANGAREGGFGATKGRYWRRAERPEWAHSDPGEAGYLPSRSLTIRDHRGGRAERPHSTSRPADRQRRQGGEIWREERAGG